MSLAVSFLTYFLELESFFPSTCHYKRRQDPSFHLDGILFPSACHCKPFSCGSYKLHVSVTYYFSFLLVHSYFYKIYLLTFLLYHEFTKYSTIRQHKLFPLLHNHPHIYVFLKHSFYYL